jgi:hypothetical protein
MYSVNCNYCKKTISSAGAFRRHCETSQHKLNYSKSLTPKNNIIMEKNIPIVSQNTILQDEFKCINCNQKYANKSNLTRHSKNCKATQTKLTEINKEYLDVVSGNKTLADVLQKITDNTNNTTTNNITININGDTNNINNTTTTNNVLNYRNVNNNIKLSEDQKNEIFEKYWKDNKINPLGYEDLSMFEDINIIKDLFSRGLNFYGSYLGYIYSSPTNLNIQVYDKKNGLISVIYKTGEILIMTTEDVEDIILMNCLDNVDALIEKYIKDSNIPDHHKKIVQRLIDQHAESTNINIPRYIKLVKLAIANASESPLNGVKTYKDRYKKDILENGIFSLPYPGTTSRTEPTNK